MIINKSAWHYKIQDKTGANPWHRNNLCSYMRGLFLAFVLLGMGILMTSMIIFLLSSLLWGWFVPGVTDEMFMGGTILTVFIWAASKIYSNDHQDNFWFKNRHITPPTVKTPSIFIAWIKSLHDKTCPLVEFKDDTKNVD